MKGLLLVLLLAAGVIGQPMPSVEHEFRAVWIATVDNIDFPTKRTLTIEQQKAELIRDLDLAKKLRMNAVIFQVRPMCDAVYRSEIEPWSEFLTGEMGKPQTFDPLEFLVAEAHRRGILVHAWFNPFRACHPAQKGPYSASHVSVAHPSWVHAYGKYEWMDPGIPEARDWSYNVFMDVLARYDIDGVHIDDYFYPYPIEAGGGPEGALDGAAGSKPELDFPDQPSWQRYLLGGGKLAKPDWRRQNVNQLIEALYKGIHAEKSWVRFGISPFGLGRPDRRPPGIAGFSQYDKLYADAETWLDNGWLDYLSPQLYWPIGQAPQAYGVLLDYWLAQNRQHRHIWPGLFTSRIGAATKAYAPDEIVQQIGLTRTRPQAGGHVHFSIAALMDNRQGISDQLMAGHYAEAALVPATPWLGNKAPAAPAFEARRSGGGIVIKFAAGSGNPLYAVWSLHGTDWRFSTVPGGQASCKLDGASAAYVSAVDRLGNESVRVPASTVSSK